METKVESKEKEKPKPVPPKKKRTVDVSLYSKAQLAKRRRE